MTQLHSERGVSLPELLIVVSVIGVLSSLALPNFSNILSASASAVAGDMVEQANQAVKHYEQSSQPIGVAADSASAADEQAIIGMLVVEDEDLKGSPFLAAQFPATASSDSAAYRLSWTGRSFRVIEPGTAGTGVRLGVTP